MQLKQQLYVTKQSEKLSLFHYMYPSLSSMFLHAALFAFQYRPDAATV